MAGKAAGKKNSFHVIWKRPDGFHGAHPSDFRVATVGDAKLWLHKRDYDEFPFKVAGGWEADDATRRLNNLLNVIDEDSEGFARFLEKTYDDRMKDDPAQFIQNKIEWVSGLIPNVKGDTWEAELMKNVLETLVKQIESAKSAFSQLVAPKQQ